MTRRTSKTGAFSAPRMRTPRGPSRTLRSLHRTVSTSDAPVVTRRHVRTGFRCIRPMRCPSKTRPFGLVKEGLNLRARGPCFDLPVRVRRAKAQERLPSYREAASFYTCSPRVLETLGHLHERAPFRLLPIRAPRQAVLRTSFWLALQSPTDLAIYRPSKRAMRSTDVCHPIELRAPAPRVFPARSRHFHGGEAPWRLRLHAARLGDRTFHDARRTLRRVVIAARISFSIALRPGDTNVGIFFPRR